MKTEDLIALAHTVHGDGGCEIVGQHSPFCLRVQTALTTAAEKATKAATQKAEKLLAELQVFAEQAKARNDGATFVSASGGAKAAFVLARLIMLPEDGCQVCLGTGQVPSSFAPGQLVPCDCMRAAG